MFKATMAILELVLILATLPISLPLAVLLEWRQTRRLNAAVAGICCERCGKFLDKAALATADAADGASLAALQRRYPNSLVNVVRRADASAPDAAEHTPATRGRPSCLL